MLENEQFTRWMENASTPTQYTLGVGPIYQKWKQFSTLHSTTIASYIKFFGMEMYYTNVTDSIVTIARVNYTDHELGSLKLERPALARYHNCKEVADFPNYLARKYWNITPSRVS